MISKLSKFWLLASAAYLALYMLLTPVTMLEDRKMSNLATKLQETLMPSSVLCKSKALCRARFNYLKLLCPCYSNCRIEDDGDVSIGHL